MVRSSHSLQFRLVPLDFSSRTGKSLLERARRVGGEWTIRAVPRFERLFRLVSPFAPGLAFVGGQLSATPFDPAAPSSVRLNVGGTGTSAAAALVSCLGEGLERLSQMERRGDAAPYRPAAKDRGGIDATIADWLNHSFGDIAASDHGSLDWRTVVEASTGRRSVVPADLCLRRSEGRRRLPLHWPLSIGCAAGATSDRAASRAVLELVERDAVAMWWRGGRRGRPVAPDGPIARSSARLLARLRRGQSGRSTRLLDITTELEIPALAALSTDPDGRGLAVGFACRLSAVEAASAAVLEMAQVETAFALIGAKLAEGGPAVLDETDRRHLQCGAFDPRQRGRTGHEVVGDELHQVAVAGRNTILADRAGIGFESVGEFHMDNRASGFLIDEVLYPWGTLFDAAAPGRVQSGYASAKLPCRSAYGFATVYAEPAAARPDRPVTTVTYELADTSTAPRYLFAELVKRLGQPDEVTRDDSPEAANENTVVLHANWLRDKVRIGLSLYGARRPSEFGDALGALYLSWTDQDAAAQPFLPAWVAANAAAASAAEGAKLRVFSVRYDIYGDDYPPPSPAELALQSPHVLLTPAAIAARLGKTTFALWTDAAGLRWFLSTARTTVLLGGEETSVLHFYDVAPARGGGFTEIGMASWSVRDAHGSASMKDALAALEAIPGLQVERSAGHDA